MWKAYVAQLLKDNPDYYTKHKPHAAVPKYYVYKMNNGKKIGKKVPIIQYDEFRKIIETFLDKAKTEIIQGNSVTIPHCGRIAAQRIERDFRSKRKPKDWKRTMASGKNPETGKYNKVYYFTNDDYSRIAWFKTNYVTNISLYEFVPTASGASNKEGGFKTQFSKALETDEFLKYRFLFSPLTEYVMIEEEQEAINSESNQTA